MKQKNQISDQNSSDQSFSLLEDLKPFEVTYDNSLVQDDSENEKRFSSDLSEYPTVRYNITMNRYNRRMLLQTILDQIVNRSDYPFLYLAEYLLIEDLSFQIQENDSKEDLSEIVSISSSEMLSISYYFLKHFPIRTRIQGTLNYDLKSEDIKWIIERNCQYFRLSDLRTLNSRLQAYFPSKYVSFAVEVPLSSRKKQSSNRYSSYTKGYQESHPKKLQSPKDWEIDGSDIYDFENSQTLEPNPLLLDQLEVEDNWMKIRRREDGMSSSVNLE